MEIFCKPPEIIWWGTDVQINQLKDEAAKSHINKLRKEILLKLNFANKILFLY